jgi:hypothetical protein
VYSHWVRASDHISLQLLLSVVLFLLASEPDSEKMDRIQAVLNRTLDSAHVVVVAFEAEIGELLQPCVGDACTQMGQHNFNTSRITLSTTKQQH